MADEELSDPKKYFEESCKPKCVKPLLDYQNRGGILEWFRSYDYSLQIPMPLACIKRIQGDESGHKHCTGQYFDYWSCVDTCVAPKLFPKLK